MNDTSVGLTCASPTHMSILISDYIDYANVDIDFLAFDGDSLVNQYIAAGDDVWFFQIVCSLGTSLQVMNTFFLVWT